MPSVSAGMRLSQTVDWSEESDENENDDPPNAPKKTIQKSSKTKSLYLYLYYMYSDSVKFFMF